MNIIIAVRNIKKYAYPALQIIRYCTETQNVSAHVIQDHLSSIINYKQVKMHNDINLQLKYNNVIIQKTKKTSSLKTELRKTSALKIKINNLQC